MKAIILVGGKGTRLRPLTLHKPKPLLPILNIPFLVRQLHWLLKHGVSDVTMSLGYLPDEFEEYFSTNPFDGLHIKYVVEDSPLGTAGAIKFAAQDVDGDFIVCNGDVLTDMDLSALVDFHKSNGSMATISLTYVEDPSAFGVVPTHEDGQVIAFVEKPPRESAPSHWINAGTYVLKPEFLDLIPADIQVSVERETFPQLLQESKMYAQESTSYWLDIGTPEKYIKAHVDGLENIAEDELLINIENLSASLFGPKNSQYSDDLQVKGNSLIGNNVKIGRNVILDSAVIGDNCIIEDNCVISNAVIHDDVHIENDCVIEKSIVALGSRIGRNSKLEEYTLIGANEKIDPNSELQSSKVPSEV